MITSACVFMIYKLFISPDLNYENNDEILNIKYDIVIISIENPRIKNIIPLKIVKYKE